MPVIDLQNVSFAYTGGSGDGCLRGIDLDIEPGEVVLLCGPSGCGKTTLTRLINGLVPHYYDGALTGRVLVAGQNVAETPLYEMAKWVGSVFQNPRSQFFNVETTGEMAFCCENLGVPVAEIRRRMAAVVNSLDMQHLMGRSMFRLSGGEKQRVACAAVSVAEPAVVVLDEPSSNLDMAAIHGLRRQIARWKQQGKTVVVAEHRLHYLNGLADRVLYMRDGAVAIEFTPDKLSAMGAQELDALGLRPFSWDMLHGYKGINRAADSQSAEIRLNRFHFGYRRCPACLNVDGAAFPGNGIVALIGKNGAGKSTLARCLCGL